MNRLIRRVVRCALLAALSGAALAGGPAPDAAPAPHPQGSLRLADALAATLRGGPELARFAYDRRAAEARRLQAGLRPNPELGLDIENLAGSRDYRGALGLETTLRLGSFIELGGKRQARLQLAERGLEGVEADYALARLDAVTATTTRFIDVVASQLDLALAERGIDYAAQTLAAAERRIRAGAASSIERNRATIALQRAQLEREHYEHLLATQRRQLSAQWGETEPGFERAQAELLQLPAVADYPELLARLRRSPDFARYDIERRVREADLQLALAKAVPDPMVSAGLRNIGDGRGGTDTALVAYLLMPLPWNNRNQGAIAEARAGRERVEVEQRAAAVRSETALYEQAQELRHARTLVEAIRDTLLPQADEALRLIRQGYGAGRLSQLDILDAQKTRLDLEAELLANAADYHRRLAAIERMTALAAPETPTTDQTVAP